MRSATILARRDARFLVFDEPEAGIDLWSFSNLIDVFRNLKEERSRALFVISHQERILEIADEIVVIAAGQVRLSGGREQVLPQLMAGEKQGCVPSIVRCKEAERMNTITEKLLKAVSDYTGAFQGAYNIREDGGCAARQFYRPHSYREQDGQARHGYPHRCRGPGGEGVYPRLRHPRECG